MVIIRFNGGPIISQKGLQLLVAPASIQNNNLLIPVHLTTF